MLKKIASAVFNREVGISVLLSVVLAAGVVAVKVTKVLHEEKKFKRLKRAQREARVPEVDIA